MKLIPLNTYKKKSQKLFTKVDDCMFGYLSQWSWITMKAGNKTYAMRWDYGDEKRRGIMMHRVVLETQPGLVTDHEDGDGLNNQKYNLREATQSQNAANIKSQENSSSKYLGVYWATARKKWFVTICKDKKRIFIGRFSDEIEAAMAYNEAAVRYHGAFASLNKC